MNEWRQGFNHPQWTIELMWNERVSIRNKIKIYRFRWYLRVALALAFDFDIISAYFSILIKWLRFCRLWNRVLAWNIWIWKLYPVMTKWIYIWDLSVHLILLSIRCCMDFEGNFCGVSTMNIKSLLFIRLVFAFHVYCLMQWALNSHTLYSSMWV